MTYPPTPEAQADLLDKIAKTVESQANENDVIANWRKCEGVTSRYYQELSVRGHAKASALAAGAKALRDVARMRMVLAKYATWVNHDEHGEPCGYWCDLCSTINGHAPSCLLATPAPLTESAAP